jgi:hypothetical protein
MTEPSSDSLLGGAYLIRRHNMVFCSCHALWHWQLVGQSVIVPEDTEGASGTGHVHVGKRGKPQHAAWEQLGDGWYGLMAWFAIWCS